MATSPPPLRVMTVGLAKAKADASARRHRRHQTSFMRRFSVVLSGAVTAFLLFAVAATTTACSTSEVPTDAMNSIIRATLEKNPDALWDRLTPSSQALLERIAAEDAIARGQPARPAKDRLLNDGLDLAVGMADFKEVARNGDDALLVATDHEGKEKEVHVRRVDGKWRLQLKAATLANAPDPFAAARKAHAAKTR